MSDQAQLLAADPTTLPRPLPAWKRWTSSVWFLEDELSLLPSLVGPGDLCIDIGAGNGVYTLFLARLVGASGAVHAVEPQPFGLRNLRVVRRALGPRVRVHDLALTNHTGHAEMVVPRRLFRVHGRAYVNTSGTQPHPYSDEFKAADAIQVRMTTLDRLVQRHRISRVAFIKCDVEGGELQVLQGGEATLARDHPSLLIEIEPRHTRKYAHTAEQVFAWLHHRGYTPHALMGGYVRPLNGPIDSMRNYLFLARDTPALTASITAPEFSGKEGATSIG